MLGVVNRWAGRAYRDVVAAVNLPTLLIKTGAMTGPYFKEPIMGYIKGLWHDACMAYTAARSQWRYCRTHLRRGGSPDVEF